MKDKVLIIGQPGTGKTSLGKLMANLMDYDLADEFPSALRLSLTAEPRTVYVSNCITMEEAAMYLKGFTIIEVSNL